MEDRPHIIQKIQADLKLHSDEKHSEKSEKFKRAIQDAMRSLSPTLDDLAGESHFKIDSLSVEIDLPEADFAQIDKKIADAVRDKIEKLFKSQEETTEIVSNKMIQKLSEEDSYHEIISSFLKTGEIPWWAEKSALDEAENWLMNLSADEWISLIKPLVQDHIYVVNRLVRQFSPAVVQELVRKTVEGQPGSGQLLNLQDEILRFLQNQNLSTAFIHEIERDFISGIIKGKIAGVAQEKLVEHLFISAIKKMISREAQTGGSKKIVTDLRLWLNRSEQQEREYWVEQLEDLSSSDNWIEDRNDELLIEDDFPKESEIDIEPEYIDHRGEISVDHAGVVILHPFLDSLFKNLGYVEDGEFLNQAARERAVCLIHYLATGEESFPEYELQLPKFLCRWPTELPINRYLQLSETEKEECKSVLSSSLTHWEALKSTRIEGLRENFLKREGILRREEFGWSLYIEEKTIDILLDKLPWNLSIIKLKWMDEILTVHWH
ncbi:MAG: hypothetical protein GVY20_00045 [Bacteroidetes bacterium]|jgi:hypothetical protein|nr:hypothetical protein [Bacteroidota bacterium]